MVIPNDITREKPLIFVVSVPYFSGFMVIPVVVWVTKRTQRAVSVPYFSGFMVIHHFSLAHLIIKLCFSPLFFGVYGDTM